MRVRQPSLHPRVGSTVARMSLAYKSVVPEIEAPAPAPSPPGSGRGFLFFGASLGPPVGADRNPSPFAAASTREGARPHLTSFGTWPISFDSPGQIRRESKAENWRDRERRRRILEPSALAAIIRQMSGPVTPGQGSPATPTTLPGSKPALHFSGGICYDCSASHCIRRLEGAFVAENKGNPL